MKRALLYALLSFVIGLIGGIIGAGIVPSSVRKRRGRWRLARNWRSIRRLPLVLQLVLPGVAALLFLATNTLEQGLCGQLSSGGIYISAGRLF